MKIINKLPKMKIIKSSLFFISINLFLLMFSCSKTASEPTVSENLLIGKWQLESSKLNGKTVVIKDCEKDNLWVFSKDFNGIVELGTNKCSTTEVNVNFNWNWINESLKIFNLTTLTKEGVCTIQYIDKINMKLQIQELPSNNYEYVFVRK